MVVDRKYVLPSGRMVLEYADAVHESVFRDLRVIFLSGASFLCLQTGGFSRNKFLKVFRV
jgi:hypothetical protein